jgi:hypothetical protein
MTVGFLSRGRQGGATLSLLFAYDFKKGNGDKAPGGRDQRVASFVPLRVLLAAQNVKEVTLVEGQLLSILVLRLVVVQRLDDLLGWKCLDGLGSNGEIGWFGSRVSL